MILKIARYIFLVILGSALGIATLDVALRSSKIQTVLFPVQIRSHPFRNHSFTENFTQTIQPHPEIAPYIFHTNSLGLKENREFTTYPDKGIFRVIICGDSFVESFEPSRSFTVLLENSLNEKLKSNGIHIQLINAGISSYSPTLHYFHLQQSLLNLHPDLVVIAIDDTDHFDDAVRYASLVVHTDDGVPISVKPSETAAWQLVSQERDATVSHFDRLLSSVAPYSPFAEKALQFRLPSILSPQKLYSPDPGFSKLYDYEDAEVQKWQQTSVGWLNQIYNLLKAAQVRMAITVYPHEKLINPDSWKKFQRSYRSFSEQHEISYNDSGSALEKAYRKGKPYLTNDMHFNYEGIQVWAEDVGKFLEGIIAQSLSVSRTDARTQGMD